MIETVTSEDLPIDEKLMIKKNRICPRVMSEDDASLKRISIVTGIHGDELEGQYVCYELQRRIMEEYDNLQGIVDIYPAMNPLGIDSITRGIPAFDLDMNRLFPGNKDGNMTEYIAAGIMEDVAGSDLVFDIHASNIYLTEMPQIRNMLHIADSEQSQFLQLTSLSLIDKIGSLEWCTAEWATIIALDGESPFRNKVSTGEGSSPEACLLAKDVSDEGDKVVCKCFTCRHIPTLDK